MVALGLGTVWAGYYLFMYGYCLVRGYDVTLASMMHSTWPGAPQAPAAAGSPPAGGGGAPGARTA